MKTSTLFSAFIKVNSRMSSIKLNRGSSFGILVAEDPAARRYQKLDRLYYILRDKIAANLRLRNE